jgi:hypothetical protein
MCLRLSRKPKRAFGISKLPTSTSGSAKAKNPAWPGSFASQLRSEGNWEKIQTTKESRAPFSWLKERVWNHHWERHHFFPPGCHRAWLHLRERHRVWLRRRDGPQDSPPGALLHQDQPPVRQDDPQEQQGQAQVHQAPHNQARAQHILDANPNRGARVQGDQRSR